MPLDRAVVMRNGANWGWASLGINDAPSYAPDNASSSAIQNPNASTGGAPRKTFRLVSHGLGVNMLIHSVLFSCSSSCWQKNAVARVKANLFHNCTPSPNKTGPANPAPGRGRHGLGALLLVRPNRHRSTPKR